MNCLTCACGSLVSMLVIIPRRWYVVAGRFSGKDVLAINKRSYDG
jgi:hypothetical protein